MTEAKPAAKAAAELLARQMRSRPLLNRAAKAQRVGRGTLQLSVPFEYRGLTRALRHVLPLSAARNVELDPIGAEFFALCDGEHTVEEIVDRYMARWRLSFFEARGVVLQYLRDLLKRNLVVLAAPDER